MKILFWILKILLVIVAGVILIIAKISYLGGDYQKTWKPTKAEVVRSEVIFKQPKTQNPRIIERSYYWEFDYAYTYDEKKYVSSGLFGHGSFKGDKQDQENRVKKYPKGKQITVYVNPEDPSKAYVQRRTAGFIEDMNNMAEMFFNFSLFVLFYPLISKMFKSLFKKLNRHVKSLGEDTDNEKASGDDKAHESTIIRDKQTNKSILEKIGFKDRSRSI